MSDPWIKTPNEELDFTFDFQPAANGQEGAETDALEAGETINTDGVTVTVPAAVQSSKPYELLADQTQVKVWTKAGLLKQDYLLTCKVVTSMGRTIERSKWLYVRNKEDR